MTTEDTTASLGTRQTTKMVSRHASDGVCRYVSSASQSLLGFHPNELVGTSPYDFVHPDDEAAFQQAHSSILRHPTLVTVTYRARRQDGTYTWLESHCQALRNPKTGQIGEILVSSYPADERERSEVKAERPAPAPEQSLEPVSDGMFAVDRNWHITFSNDQAARLTEYSPDRLLGMEVWEAFPGASGSAFETSLRDAMASEDSRTCEVYYAKRDVELRVRICPAPEGLAVFVDDINQRKQHEIVLRDSERFLQLTLDALSAHIAILDETGMIIAVNSAWREFAMGNSLQSAAQGLGVSYLTACDRAAERGAGGAKEVAAGIRSVIAGEQDSFTWEYPCHSPTEQRWFIARVTRFREGPPLRVAVSHENITLRRQAELRRASVEARYRTLFEEIEDVVLVADSEARYIDANPAASKMLGYSREEFQQLGVPDIVANSKEWAVSEYGRMKDEGSWRGELELRHKNGQLIPVEANATALEAAPDPIYVSVIRDISERRTAERMQHEFISMVTHDLRTPLTTIKGFAQLLQRRQEYRESAVQQISSQAEQLERLITDLSEVSQIRTGSLSFEPVQTDLVTLVHDVAESAGAMTERHEIRVDTPPGSLVGVWDPIRLTQVLQNLLSNAIKYSPDAGEIQIRVEPQPDEILVSVQDQGIGIAPEHIKDLFEPFYRADSAAITASGLGIGLAISKAVIESHGGRIWVESVPGQGSTFYFALPLG